MAVTRLSNSGIKTGILKYDSTLAGYPPVMPAPTAADGGTGSTATITFSAVSGATGYRAISSPGGFTGTGSSSPVTVSGLTAGTAYTFQIQAQNSVGYGAYSAASNSVTPLDPFSFVSIATVLGDNSSSSITFSSIPTTYKHLQIRCITRDTFTTFSGNYGLSMSFLGNTGANYSCHLVGGLIDNTFSNVSTTSANGIELRNMGMWAGSPVPANTFACGIIDIQDYSSSTKTPSVRVIAGGQFNSTGGSAKAGISLISGAFNSTTPITSITISGAATAFATGSSFALYGIKG